MKDFDYIDDDDWINFVEFSQRYGFKKRKNIIGCEYIQRGNISFYQYGTMTVNQETLDKNDGDFGLTTKQMKTIIFILFEEM